MQMIMFSKKRSHEKIVKRVLREKNCWKKKSLMDRKMEKQLNKKTILKSRNKKLMLTVQNFLLMSIICQKKYGIIFWEQILWITRSAKYGIIFCEQMSWITRSTKWVRLAKCTWSCSHTTCILRSILLTTHVSFFNGNANCKHDSQFNG